MRPVSILFEVGLEAFQFAIRGLGPALQGTWMLELIFAFLFFTPEPILHKKTTSNFSDFKTTTSMLYGKKKIVRAKIVDQIRVVSDTP